MVAAGLDPERSILFRQSDVPEHTELTWLLSSVTPLGELNRMHQFRDKSVQQREMVSSGLLFYPVLMAADVLAYRAHEVPVGEDQREHIELMRDVARALQRPLRRAARRARGAVSRRSARGSSTSRSRRGRCRPPAAREQGTVYVMDEPDVVRKEVQARADRLRARDRPRAGQAGRHQPDRHPRRGAGRRRRRRSSATSTAAATATSRPRSATRWRSGSRRCASATRSCAATRRSSRRSSPRAPRRRARSPR